MRGEGRVSGREKQEGRVSGSGEGRVSERGV